MTIYIDRDFKCHAHAAEGLRAIEVPFFEGKCKRFIEGFRYVPPGETWVREDGQVFTGEMRTPIENYSVLESAQQIYLQLQPRLEECLEKLREIGECLDGLATNPGIEQLLDFIRIIRELIED